MTELVSLLSRLQEKRIRFSHAQETVRAYASDFLKQAGLRPLRTPIDPMPLMERRRIKSVNIVDMDKDGLLYATSEDTLAADINRGNPIARQRFTCLHEVGHTFFIRDLANSYRSRLSIADTHSEVESQETSIEERLCDVFASEVLLPRNNLAARILKSHLSWNTVLDLAHECGTSITATALASVKAGIEPALLLCWRVDRVSSRLTLLWQSHAPNTSSRVASSFSPSIRSLFQGADPSQLHGEVVSGKSFLEMDPQGGSWNYAETIVLGNRALTLVYFSPHAAVFGSSRVRRSLSRHQLDLFS